MLKRRRPLSIDAEFHYDVSTEPDSGRNLSPRVPALRIANRAARTPHRRWDPIQPDSESAEQQFTWSQHALIIRGEHHVKKNRILYCARFAIDHAGHFVSGAFHYRSERRWSSCLNQSTLYFKIGAFPFKRTARISFALLANSRSTATGETMISSARNEIPQAQSAALCPVWTGVHDDRRDCTDQTCIQDGNEGWPGQRRAATRRPALKTNQTGAWK